MTQLEINSLDVSIPSASIPDQQTAHRLIVLVPEFGTSHILIARKVQELAYRFERRVQLIALSPDVMNEPGLHRQLITLSAHIENAHVLVETKIEVGRSWLKAIQPYWREGDMVVCFAETGLGLRDQKLRQLLESAFGASVYVVADLLPRKPNSFSFLKSNAFTWISSLALIVGFFVLQVKLFPLMSDRWNNFLLYFSIVIEAVSVWLLNGL